ncbi:hypothetical protein [Pararhizobium sp. IMCC21322]|uniref:hypothetical protein n=1 Tax=Pararhizobium sp. IMCC21322 TaxID=3067903 RepID=UPI002740FE67|nr:hypothetical protein [Pararhizobium sp. IMCC21322]
MKKIVFAALAVLAAAAISSTLPAVSAGMNRTVECDDGTIFKFGDDAISGEVACAYNGGVKPESPVKAREAKMENTPPAPIKPARASVQNTTREGVPDETFDSKNKAVAWTAGCYAEFGPGASDPDAALLEKCLGN